MSEFKNNSASDAGYHESIARDLPIVLKGSFHSYTDPISTDGKGGVWKMSSKKMTPYLLLLIAFGVFLVWLFKKQTFSDLGAFIIIGLSLYGAYVFRDDSDARRGR